MIKIILFIFYQSLFAISYNIQYDYGTVILYENEEYTEYENPFLGGFNKPKIQWLDWNHDGIDDLFLLDEDGCIRYFIKNQENDTYQLEDTSFLGISNISWFYFADYDLDSQYEIITQDPNNIDQMVYYDILNENIINLGTIISEDSNSPVISSAVMTPTFCDIDFDGDLDFFTGNMIGTINFYQNVGLENDKPIFHFISNFWEEIYIVGPSQNRHGASAINFIDIDSDGDYDLSWGDYYQQSLYIIKNIGSAINPNMDNLDIITYFPHESPVLTAGLNMPTFSDVDNDGDEDLFVTVLSGAYGFQLKNNFYFYENISDDFSNNYIFQTSEFIPTIDFLSDVAPSFVDIDNDSLIDMFIGTDFDPSDFPWTGKIKYLNNSGYDTSNDIKWIIEDDDFLNQNLGNNLVLDFVDIDNDSDFDMFVGDYNGYIRLLENITTDVQYEFVFDENQLNIDLSGYSIPRLVDIDNDNDFDLFIGQINGKISFYENIGDSSVYNFNFISDNFENIAVGSRSAPEFSDIDLDGDYDLLIGSAEGDIVFYENIGNSNNYNFELNPNINFPFLGKNTIPKFINNRELFVGTSTGGIYYLKLSNHPDINGDFEININDILVLVEIVINQENVLCNCSNDINYDGVINVVDIIEILNLIL